MLAFLIFHFLLHAWLIEKHGIKKAALKGAAFAFLFLRLKGILAQAAKGADIILRHVLPGGAGGDAVIRVSLCRVIYISAGGANIFFHGVLSLLCQLAALLAACYYPYCTWPPLPCQPGNYFSSFSFPFVAFFLYKWFFLC
jgi:hypothetical protein